MSDFKKMYAEATVTMAEAAKTRVVAATGILTEFLAEKGLEAGKSCRLNCGKGANEKNIIGMFSIVPTEDSAMLKFMPYKKAGTLSKNSKSFCFGRLPDMVWDTSVSLVNTAVPCATPRVGTGEEED